MNHICIDKYLDNKNARQAVGPKDKFWEPGDKITIGFLDGTSTQQDMVEQYAKEWVEYANLRFEFTNTNPIIKIGFDSRDGAWSYIGTDNNLINGKTMNFGWVDKSVILHEFGHMIGLGHEHQNPEGGIEWNEEAVIKDLSGAPNFWDYNTIVHNVLNKYSYDQIIGTRMDPLSIMMYSIPNNWTIGDFSTGFNGDLSKLDMEFISTIYPKEDEPQLEALDFARMLFLEKAEIARMKEITIVRLGEMLDLPVKRSLLKSKNCAIVYDKLKNN